ncbi:hypothetical protein WHI96_06140 [Pseudonocardia tropica]|uniref:Uncharacterized protein n=1 Tax=Pseudonocardia tropica TaxID=681289 RepID=A0ABV1JR29_9PSEU
MRFDVAADSDPTTMTTGTHRDGETTFQNLRVDAVITTDGTDEQVAQPARETERRRPGVAAVRPGRGVDHQHLDEGPRS